ncbi:hypothetical protein [Oligosphaera ethanolica]|uniref:Uncharacterized protein n=1 Tax=Oligosphaera ethanolica TaxID=760260 RepID=A0AAE3VJ01_9BACT|nr:hypothetical protein [Oligosphaera ethanolica]MDQ0290989.1 hypothetical protein [Oligosphaera ethanolica]
MKLSLFSAIVLTFGILAASPLRAQDVDLAAIVKSQAERSSVWSRVQALAPNMTSRELFTYALLLCEAQIDLDRIDRLFEVAARMQDRDPESRGYGNFRWNWRDGAVLDFNAGDFCMENAAVIWIKHRELLSDKQRQALSELIHYAIEGCLRHRVPASYTNIAIMNAQNLILMGEMLGRDDVLAEGRKRLDDFCAYTATNGIHEYCSPTYAGVDLMCLHRLHTYCVTPAVREQCDALLSVFWTDAIANCFAPAFRLGGAHSRDYDYLGGRGIIDSWLAAAGCFADPNPNATPPLLWLQSSWRPAPAWLRELQSTPRFVTQVWGPSSNEYRVMWAGKHVALSVAGKNYHNMDAPMVVNFAGPQHLPRGYFIADGRRDPYGKKVIPEGAGPHQKTLHLMPNWYAVQDGQDALGLALHRQDDSRNYPTLESHFVLPYPCDELFIGDRAVAFDAKAPRALPVAPGETVVIRHGGAAAAIRVVWGQNTAGEPAPVALIHDGNRHGVIRLTVAHHDQWGMPIGTNAPVGAAFWVRVFDQADDADLFAQWCQDFAAAAADARCDGDSLAITASAASGQALRLLSYKPFTALGGAEPLPERAVLAVNGRDLGGEYLAGLPAVIAYKQQIAEALKRQEGNAITVLPDRDTTWEAEAAAVFPNMVAAKDDPQASGNGYVWGPGEPGARGGGGGYVLQNLQVVKAGLYYLSARVIAPSPEDDSFFVSASGEKFSILDQFTWHLPTVSTDWYWAMVADSSNPDGIPMRLPEGMVTLRVQVREDGAKIDQFRLSPEPGLH